MLGLKYEACFKEWIWAIIAVRYIEYSAISGHVLDASLVSLMLPSYYAQKVVAMTWMAPSRTTLRISFQIKNLVFYFIYFL